MIIRIGPFRYSLSLAYEPISDDAGQRCAGLTDPNAQAIYVAAELQPEKRLATAWHEIGHAWKTELDIHEAPQLGEESMCNLIGMAMAHMPPKDLLKIHVYMTQGIDCRDVCLLFGTERPVPAI